MERKIQPKREKLVRLIHNGCRLKVNKRTSHCSLLSKTKASKFTSFSSMTSLFPPRLPPPPELDFDPEEDEEEDEDEDLPP